MISLVAVLLRSATKLPQLPWIRHPRLPEGHGRFNNLPGGVFEIRTDEHFGAGHFEVLVIVNEGTMRKVAGDGTTILALNAGGGGKTFHNRGTLGVDSGRLQIQGRGTGSGVGRVEIAEGATLDYAGGGHVYEAGSEIFSAGTLAVSGATVVLRGDYTLPSVAVSSGTLNVEGELMANSLGLSGGQIGAAGKVTVLDSFTWTAGAMHDEGETLMASTATATLSGTGQKQLATGRVWSNAGMVRWEQGLIWVTGGTGRFNNLQGGVFDIHTDERFGADFFAELVIDNRGSIRKSAGEGRTHFGETGGGGGKVLHNSGVIDIGIGEVLISNRNQGIFSGSIVVGANGRLILSNSSYVLADGHSFVGTGTLRFQSPVTLQAPVNFNSLNVFVENNATFTGAFPMSIGADGSITFRKSISLPDALTVAGTMTVESNDLTVTVPRTFTLASTGILNNPGTVRVGEFANDGGTVNGNAPVVTGLQQNFVVIDRITLGKGGFAQPSGANSPSYRSVILHWTGPPAVTFVLESSENLNTWKLHEARIAESSSGRYEGTAVIDRKARSFFRIRSQVAAANGLVEFHD